MPSHPFSEPIAGKPASPEADRRSVAGASLNRRQFVGLSLAAGGAAVVGAVPGWAAEASGDPPDQKCSSDWAVKIVASIGRDKLEAAVRAACTWLTDIAQLKNATLGPAEQLDPASAPEKANSAGIAYRYTNWTGAMRGEYAPHGSWSFFGPIWHTGQAVKALALAHAYFHEPAMLEGARLGATFILNQQIHDPAHPDTGAIFAYEDQPDRLNTSCLFEACDGLFTLSELTGDEQYATRAVEAIGWTVQRMYQGKGTFFDGYDFASRQTYRTWPDQWSDGGRPLLDDGVLLKAYQRSKNERFREVFLAVADRLLQREAPSGNWVGYAPCNWKIGLLHPRQAFWWGRPLWMAWRETGQARYRDAFLRACRWYVQAMRRDGGILRRTYADGSSESFGHVTSATCCACMLFRDAAAEVGSDEFTSRLELGLRYAMSMQVTKPEDPNMQGVIIEKCLPPSQTDANPWRVRDLGTTFFVTAATQLLRDAG